ncbi:succinate dehydrogenase, cytochrome b556 subunit [Hydrogenovibrio sp. SC-1]|uniref:succinate dehydrogenase, cytochrome b556 subunit n=1 Tax=Hydrogenovibrio sp. SC-1 TaxID=2065820 RepID=UPI000C7D6A2B|nr:succinate dehydrogenase, cytochrome b556 subunit [Hydrogenovibrio sp. SC-1]PLA74539.1 succinate dehydrogenase, cytochrome b556 subunit [Hydrogenovibrio sp. SC-1]
MYHHPGNKPVYLNLRAFRFPLNAILSILHRISGVFVLMSLILGLVWLNLLLLQPESYQQTRAWLSHPLGKIVATAGLLGLSFHWLTGLRHLLMEHDVAQLMTRLDRSRLSGQGVLVIFVIWSVWVIWRLW